MNEKAKNVARLLCIDLGLDLEALERDIEDIEAHAGEEWTPEQEAAFQKLLAEFGAVYNEEDDTVEFITKQ